MYTQSKAILHISNDYTGSIVYKNLVRELDRLGVKQLVYTPFREQSKTGSNQVDLNVDGSEIIYASIINWHIDRVFYPYKTLKILKDIQKKVDFSQIDCIHAHTWCSDGGVVYFLAKNSISVSL